MLTPGSIMLGQIKQELKKAKTLLTFTALRAVGQSLGMIAPLVLARFFSPELFGSYSLAKMVVLFFVALLINSAQTPFVVFANQEKTKTGKINESFSVQCTFLALSVFSFVCLCLIFHKSIMVFAQITLTDLFFISLGFVGIATKTFLSNLFLALGQRIKNSVAELTFGTLMVTMVIILCFTGKINLQTAFLAYLLSAIPVVGIFICSVDFNLLFPLGFAKNHFKDMFTFARWQILGTTSVYFINWGSNLVFKAFKIAMSDIGKYNLAFDFYKGLTTLMIILNAYFLPFISEHIEDSGKIKHYLYNKRPKIFLLGLVVLGLFFLAIPFFVERFYGSSYQGTSSVLKILLLASAVALYNIFYMPVLYAMKEYRFFHISILIQLLLNILFCILLVPLMGMSGAAVAAVIASFCRTLMTEAYFRVRLNKLLKL